MVPTLERVLGQQSENDPLVLGKLLFLSQVLAGNSHRGPIGTQARRILGKLTDGSDNPWQALQRMKPNDFATKVYSNGFQESIPAIFNGYVEYLLNKDTWFERTSVLSPKEKEYLKNHPITSFSLEIAIGKVPQIYSGGLGMLNGDVARQESDMGLPVDNVSLLYRGGYFKQEIDSEGRQKELYCDQCGHEFPMTEAVDKDGNKIGLIKIPMGDGDVFAKAWEVAIGRNNLYLLDTNIPENEKEAGKWITGHLYSSIDNDARIRQEIVLGVGGVCLLKALGKEPSIYHLQEGHAAFAVLEAIANLVENGMPLDKAGWYLQGRTVFTNHTIVVQDFFTKEQIDRYLGSLAQRMSTPERPVSTDELYALGEDKYGFSMTRLALNVSAKKNGVSKIHTEKLRELYPEEEIESITNGAHIETWLGEPMQNLFDKYLGNAWREELDNTVIFNKIYEIPSEELLEAKLEQKKRLITYLNDKYGCNLSPDYLTGCIARRFAMYKRNNLLFSDISQLSEIVGNSMYPTQIIIGGKAHPSDLPSKEMIASINGKIKDLRLKKRAVFVSEYDMELARLLVSGVDLWINVPRRKMEASGTSGMKAGLNGDLHLTEIDGWGDEVKWFDKGWSIGRVDDDATKMDECQASMVDLRDANDLYRFFREEIAPMFYNRKDEWMMRMKKTMIEVSKNFTTRRMVIEQIKKLYLPILEKIAEEELAEAA
ncbi:MAG: alpha-glucan family phosphorylase [Candidatus Levyibacteriota bacterium]